MYQLSGSLLLRSSVISPFKNKTMTMSTLSCQAVFAFSGTVQPARDRTPRLAERSHENLLRRTAQPMIIRGQERNCRKMFSVFCLGGELGRAGCLELSIISIDSGLLALVPLYLSETKQPPDEGYIRHALSCFPTITPWSWTITISVPCLPISRLR